jgi:hypothetical protein
MIGTWFSSAEEMLLNLGLPLNRKGARSDSSVTEVREKERAVQA